MALAPTTPPLRLLDRPRFAVDLRRTVGYLVADCNGRLVGRVERPMYSTRPEAPDALAVRNGLFGRRHRLVPADMIDGIDPVSHVIGLSVDRESLTRFL
jgi:hypothetical protein